MLTIAPEIEVPARFGRAPDGLRTAVAAVAVDAERTCAGAEQEGCC